MDRYDFDRTNEALRSAGLPPITEADAGVLPPAPPPRPAEPLPNGAPVALPPKEGPPPIARPEPWKKVAWQTSAPDPGQHATAAGLGGRGPEAFARTAQPAGEHAADVGPLEIAIQSARSPEELRAVIQQAAAEGHLDDAGVDRRRRRRSAPPEHRHLRPFRREPAGVREEPVLLAAELDGGAQEDDTQAGAPGTAGDGGQIGLADLGGEEEIPEAPCRGHLGRAGERDRHQRLATVARRHVPPRLGRLRRSPAHRPACAGGRPVHVLCAVVDQRRRRPPH